MSWMSMTDQPCIDTCLWFSEYLALEVLDARLLFVREVTANYRPSTYIVMAVVKVELEVEMRGMPGLR